MSAFNPFTVSMDAPGAPATVPEPVKGGIYKHRGIWYDFLGKSKPGRFSDIYFSFRVLWPSPNIPNPPWAPDNRHKDVTQQEWQQQHAQWTHISPENLSPRYRARPPLQETRKTTPPR